MLEQELKAELLEKNAHHCPNSYIYFYAFEGPSRNGPWWAGWIWHIVQRMPHGVNENNIY